MTNPVHTRRQASREANREASREPMLPTTQRGQSAMEYLVVCAALAFALGIGMAGEDSVLRMLLNAFAEAYDKFAYAISLPS